MDLNFAPKLRIKHNTRCPWKNEEISRIPGIFFQDDYMRELGIDPKTQLISIYRNPYSYEIHSTSVSFLSFRYRVLLGDQW